MRLWHSQLIPILPRFQLCGLHREVCALRGLAWGRRHSTVNYVFRYPPSFLFTYHMAVVAEMDRRGYRAADAWRHPTYRGKRAAPYDLQWGIPDGGDHYPEHDNPYLASCIRLITERMSRRKYPPEDHTRWKSGIADLRTLLKSLPV